MKTLLTLLCFSFISLISIANANCGDYLIPPAFAHSGDPDCPIDDEASEELVFNGNPMTHEGIKKLCGILWKIKEHTEKNSSLSLTDEEEDFLKSSCSKPKNLALEVLKKVYKEASSIFRVGAESAGHAASFLSDSNPYTSGTTSDESDYPREPVQPEHTMLKSLFDRKIITLKQLREWGVAL